MKRITSLETFFRKLSNIDINIISSSFVLSYLRISPYSTNTHIVLYFHHLCCRVSEFTYIIFRPLIIIIFILAENRIAELRTQFQQRLPLECNIFKFYCVALYIQRESLEIMLLEETSCYIQKKMLRLKTYNTTENVFHVIIVHGL